jgi:FKBP-type peptidyl-prolyl cis-trans isomerase FkpA
VVGKACSTRYHMAYYEVPKATPPDMLWIGASPSRARQGGWRRDVRVSWPLAALGLIGALACADLRWGESDSAAPDEVATTYAPELGVDLTRMESREGGLLYQDLREGTGQVAEPGRTVVFHYTGWLPDGTRFDSSLDRSQPLHMILSVGQEIPGWEVGIPGMREGGRRRLVIPYGMAYGASGRGEIPPRATLVYDVELLEVR